MDARAFLVVMVATFLPGNSPARADVVVAWTGKLKYYSSPGERVTGFDPALVARPSAQAPLPVLERADPYVRIPTRDGGSIWVLSSAAKILGGEVVLPKGFKGNSPCLGKIGAGLGSGSRC